MVPSSSKCCPQVAHKRFATSRMALSSSKFYRQGGSPKKGLLSGDKRSATVRHRMYDQIPNHLERVLPRKYRPKDLKTRTKDQRTRGPKDQRTKGPEDQGTRGPRDQRDQGIKGAGDQGTRTKGPKDQATREPADQDQRSRGNFMFDTN